MKVGITGATGFIGSEVCKTLLAHGHTPIAFSRSASKPVGPNIERRAISINQQPDVSGLDAIVNLAGEPILGIWTAAKKQKIRDSRVKTTERIVEAIAATPNGPKVLINGSAIGFYGDTRDTIVDETSPSGNDFLSNVAQKWESTATAATQTGTRVVLIRIGHALGAAGGPLKLMNPVFKLGLGGKLGSGHQWMACIHVEDIARLILFALENTNLIGPYNAVLPEPVTNTDFTKALAQAHHRPAILPVPSFALRAALGELADVLLMNTRVIPTRAQQAGFSHKYPTLPEALKYAL